MWQNPTMISAFLISFRGTKTAWNCLEASGLVTQGHVKKPKLVVSLFLSLWPLLCFRYALFIWPHWAPIDLTSVYWISCVVGNQYSLLWPCGKLTSSDTHRLSWLCLTSFLLLPSAGRAAADWSSSMGERVRLGVEHPHHRRGHRSGRLPASHRHRRSHRSNAPPPSHAFLLHGHSFYRFPVPIWRFLFLLGNEPWAAGGTSELCLENIGK